MKALKVTCVAALLLATGLFWILVLPGIRERRALTRLQSQGARLVDYRTLMGNPTAEYDSFALFRNQYANKVFKLNNNGIKTYYVYWAREGVPYYWVLLRINGEDGSVEGLNIVTAKLTP